MEMLSSKQKIAIIIAGIFVVGIFIFYMSTKTKAYDESFIKEIEEEEISKKEEKTEEISKEIIIHITGAVKKEGIVKLDEDARIIDAIEKAGGLTEDANLKMVNLAYALKDGQKIYIPKITDTEEEMELEVGIPLQVIVGNEKEDNTSGKININTATQNQLESLSGIGEKTASKIIEYREANGKFKEIEDIKNVSGIGNEKFETIKSQICAE